ncbi:DUF2627 domain-containing protein [Escherichia coli]|nr:DUF2627 domain-containing protein [Escherichia coli]
MHDCRTYYLNSGHVDVEYRFSAEPYIGASCSNVSVLSMLCLRAKKTI